MACGHLGPHGGCCSSCYLSETKNKTKNKSAKEILNKNNSFFWTNYPRSTKRTGHYAWLCCSFSWSDCAYNHPSCHRTWCSLNPCHCVKDNCGVDPIDDNSWIGNRHGCISRFNGSHDIYNYNAASSSIHSYMQQEDEPFSFPLAASHPWQSSQENQMTCWLLDTAQRKQSS